MRTILKTYVILLLVLFFPITPANAGVSLRCYAEPVQDVGGTYGECDDEYPQCCNTVWIIDYYRIYNIIHCFIFTTGAIGDLAPDEYGLAVLKGSQYVGCKTNNQTRYCPADSTTVFTGHKCGYIESVLSSYEVLGFSQSNYSEYVGIVNLCGGTPMPEPAGSIGHVLINLGAAGGECEVTYARPYTVCDPNQGCNETVVCKYERLKYIGNLYVLEPLPCGESDVGECSYGTQFCVSPDECTECTAILPTTEVCDGLDNDCDGQTDEGVKNTCGGCGPVPMEVCNNGIDDNCNGVTDEDCDDDDDDQGDDDDDCTINQGDAVNITNGNMHTTPQRDFYLKGAGLNIDFYRVYNSQKDENGPMGYGWMHNYGLNISEGADGTIRLTREDGKALYFTPDGNGGYLPPRGSGTTLSEDTSEPDKQYLYTSEEGKAYYFNNSGLLRYIEDQKGSTITLDYNPVTSLLESIADDYERTITLNYNVNGKIDSIDYSTGTLATYIYDLNDNLIEVIYPDGNSIIYEYNDCNDPHNLTASIDGNGNTASSHTYDTYDRAITAFEGNSYLGFTYDPANMRTTVTDLNTGQAATITYNEHGVSTAVDGVCIGCGGAVQSTWDTSGNNLNRLTRTDRNGIITHYDNYGSRGNPGIVTDAYGTPEERITYYTYHPFLNTPLAITRKSVLKDDGYKVTTYDYDGDGNDIPNENPTGNIYRVIEEGYKKYFFLTTYQYVTHYTYNEFGQILRIDGPREDSVLDLTVFNYYLNHPDAGNNRGQLHTIFRSPQSVITYSNYDAYGNVGRITDPNGNHTDFTYDARGRIETITQVEAGPGGADIVTEYFYDGAGNIDYIRLPKGNIVDYGYDAANRLTSITRRLGPDASSEAIDSITYEYDDSGNRLAEKYWEGEANTGTLTRKTEMEYDEFNRLWKVFDPETGGFSEYLYDPNGNRTDFYDANGKWTQYLYDNLNRLRQVIHHYESEDGLTTGTYITYYQYDLNDNLIEVKDGNGLTTTYQYDDMGRLSRVNSPDTGITRYGYDEAGNLIRKRDANGETINYLYDSGNRLCKISSPEIFYRYDWEDVTNGIGRLTQMEDPSGETLFYYDKRGNITKEIKTIKGKQYTVEYSWDANGNQESITYPSGRLVEYIYGGEDTDRVSEVWSTLNGAQGMVASDITYYPFGGRKSITYGNGVIDTITRNLNYQVSSIFTESPSGPIIDRTYQFDAAGNITGITDNLDPAKTQSFGYDSINRLSSASGVYGSFSYDYDPVGNRLAQDSPAGHTDYQYYSDTNRLQSTTGAWQSDYEYDDNGNTTDINLPFPRRKNLYYNTNNQLRGFAGSTPTGGYASVSYSYDGNGRRTIKSALEQSEESDQRDIIYVYNLQGELIFEKDITDNIFADHIYIGETLVAYADVTKLMATIDIDPDTLNLKSQGKWITCYIELPIESSLTYNVRDIDIGSILLNEEIPAETWPTNIGDYDGDGVEDLMVKFDRADVGAILEPGDNVEISITGRVNGVPFEGKDYIRVIAPPGHKGKKAKKAKIIHLGMNREGGPGDIIILFSPILWLLIWRIIRHFGLRSFQLRALLSTSALVVLVIGGLAACDRVVNISLGDGYFYHNDHLETPLMVTDSEGEVVWSVDFDPFMEIYSENNPDEIIQNFRFPGQYYDAESGLHYNMHRYYSPSTGRYITPDPIIKNNPDMAALFISFLSINPQRFSLYSYVQNNPVNRIDPLGLLSCVGHWQKKGWNRLFNITCVCYWLCVPCKGPVIWGGNYMTLPSTKGIIIHQGSGGVKSGDDCFCNTPGPQGCKCE